MFVKRNRAKRGETQYESVLLVQGQRVEVPRKVGRPNRQAKTQPKTKVVHRTIANLSKLPPRLIHLIERYCEAERKGKSLEIAAEGEETEVCVGGAYGPMAALKSLAHEMGLERVLGSHRMGKVALFLVLARVLHQGSRRSAARWASTQAIEQVLGLEGVTDKELYGCLDWLSEEQEKIERALGPKATPGAVFLYDVTSSYLEGEKNELGAYGYNRDGKKQKKQIVVGLLTDQEGEPLSVQVYDGNRSDGSTVHDQVTKLVKNYGAKDVVLVGDRGMLKSPARQLLQEENLRYVTALTKAEIRHQLSQGVLQLELFRQELVEVQDEQGVRYVLYRNPTTMAKKRQKRQSRLVHVQQKVDKRNAYVHAHPKARPETSLKQALTWLKQYKLDRWVSVRLDQGQLVLEVDPVQQQEEEHLDGCYVVISDVPKQAASTQTLWDRYGDRQKVERDFRMMKTGGLEIRPLFLRNASRTRAHALVTLLALKLIRVLEKRLRPLDLTVREALTRLDSIRLVCLADPSLNLWRLPTRYRPTEELVLSVLPPLPPPLLSRLSFV